MNRDQRWVLSVALALLSSAAGCVSATSGTGSTTGDAAGSGVAADAVEDSAEIADTEVVVSLESPAPRTTTVPPTSASPSRMMGRVFARRPACRAAIAMWMRTAWSCRARMRSGSA